jgi:hypothetical protein
MLKIKWIYRATNDELFQRMKEEGLLLKILKNRHNPWIERIISHNKFVVNILEGSLSEKRSIGSPQLQYLKQVARNAGADSYTAVKRMACNNSRWKAANQSKDRRMRRKKKFHFTCRMSSIMPAIVSELIGLRTSGDRYFSTNYCFEPVWPNVVMSRSATSASSNGVHSQNFTCICNKELNNCA